MKLTPTQMFDLPPFWLLACLVAAWAQSTYAPIPGLGADPLQLFAGLFIGAGVLLISLAVLEFRKAQTTIVPHQLPQQLITSGIFKRSRNPIYLADLFLLAGFSLFWSSWLGLALVPLLALILQRRFIQAEEARLLVAFGPAFQAWSDTTRRWL